MKKIIIVIMCMTLVGCAGNVGNEQIEEYNSFVREATSLKEETSSIHFDINVYYEQLVDEIVYRIIIDNPKEQIMNIKAVATHNYETEDIYPSVGIFEEKLHLDPNKVDLEKNYVKGIILTGYIDYDGDLDNFDVEIKLLIEYNNTAGKNRKVYYKYQK